MEGVLRGKLQLYVKTIRLIYSDVVMTVFMSVAYIKQNKAKL